jgi:hypothetical protein
MAGRSLTRRGTGHAPALPSRQPDEHRPTVSVLPGVLRCKKTGIPVIPPARDRGIAEIMVPRDVMVVDQLPLLGTGKTDYPRGADTG